jgi:hypothetical protein
MRQYLPLLLLMTCSGQAADLINVDAGVILVTNAVRVGINENYLMDSERKRLVAPPRTTQAALQEMAPRFMRYPGGGKSQSQFWSVPPWTNSQPTLCLTGPDYWPADDSEFTVNDKGAWISRQEPLTFDEFMANCQAVGAQPNIALCYSAAYDALFSGKDARPALQDEITNAVSWVRYANITKGYHVQYWTLGNPGAAQYAADVAAFSQAMKAVDPKIKFCANASQTATLQTILQLATTNVDCIEVHEYPVYNWSNQYNFFLENTTTNLGLASTAVWAIQTIQKFAPASGVQVFLGETAAHDYGNAGSRWTNYNDLGHAIVTFEIFGENLLLPQLQFAEFWNTRWIDDDLESSNTYDSFEALSSGNALNPTGRALAIWGQFLQQRLVSATSTDRVRAYASYRPGTNLLTVFLENKDTNARPTAVTLANFPGVAAAETWSFYGQGPGDLNPTWAKLADVPVSSNQIRLTLAPVSITVLVLRGPPLRLNATLVGNNLVLSWSAPGANLEQANLIGGPWTSVPGISSNPVMETVGSPAIRYFRLRQ